MLTFTKRRVLTPNPACPWASKMVLNPALVADPQEPDTIYMLFRSTGPWAQATIPGKPLPYPIFLGLGTSHDGGQSWDFDFSRPALAPQLLYDRREFDAKLLRDGKMFDYSNG